MGGTLHYTGTERGSKAIIQCGGGLELQGDDVNHVAVCTTNGSWFPDPSSQRCFETGVSQLLWHHNYDFMHFCREILFESQQQA